MDCRALNDAARYYEYLIKNFATLLSKLLRRLSTKKPGMKDAKHEFMDGSELL